MYRRSKAVVEMEGSEKKPKMCYWSHWRRKTKQIKLIFKTVIKKKLYKKQRKSLQGTHGQGSLDSKKNQPKIVNYETHLSKITRF